MVKRIDLTGDRYGGLLVLGEAERYVSPAGHSSRQWRCLCVCGKEIVVRHSNLRTGYVNKSCGCLRDKEVEERLTTHGLSKTRPYTIWMGMKTRCDKEWAMRYSNYGGRGIGYDPKWAAFEGFWEDMEEGYEDHLTLDRIDPTKGYSKENCRWATYEQQARNKLKMSNNTSGVTGVSKRTDRGRVYWTAFWNDLDGKRFSKSFPVARYGYDEAFQMACAYREQMIERMNAEGAGYSDLHGRDA